MDKEKRKELESLLYELYRTDGEGFSELMVEQMFMGLNGRSGEMKDAFKTKVFEQHRFLQSEFFELFNILLFEVHRKATEDKEKWFDPRNAWVVDLAKRTLI